MKLINTNNSKIALFALVLILSIAGLTPVMAQESASVNSNANVTPALMLSFTGVVDAKAGQLTWVTENETSAKWFVIERSTSGNEFDSIGKVMGQNNANMTTYNYSDDRLSSGNNYYRLREVDNDNVSRFSKIISLDMVDNAAKLQVYPNPASATVNYSVTSHSSDELTVQIYNLAGVLVVVHEQSIAAGVNEQSIAISNLRTGNYILKITGKQGTQFTQLFAKI